MSPTRGSTAVLTGGLVSLLLVACFAMDPGTAWGAEIIVEEGEDTLKAAVAQASPGDTLLLSPGLYELGSTVVIDKSLTIKGATSNPAEVHIVGVDAEEFNFDELQFPDPLDRGHLLFVTGGAHKVTFKYFTIKNAPETDVSEFECEEAPPFGFGLNHSECFGDAIHADGAAEVVIERVEASLNAGNGFYVDGATKASFYKVVAVNNGAFGIDIDTAKDASIRSSTFTANQISGIEASGELPGTPRADYHADIKIRKVVAKANGEIGVETERFQNVELDEVTCSDNREDGYDADRVHRVKIVDSSFINNVDDGIELFPVAVPAEEQPADFPGSIIEEFTGLVFEGNVGEDIDRPPTEN